jgi:hypothetical protein
MKNSGELNYILAGAAAGSRVMRKIDLLRT